MIYMFSGLPGSGKTLNAIKEIMENPLLKGRKVYCYGVAGLNITEWQEINEGEVRNWYGLDAGSVILIDEVQKLFRVRTANKDIPHEVQELETHRHLGIDIVLTCQNPMQVDIGVRRLVGKHYHLDRSFGLNTIRRFMFERCVDDPNKDKREASTVDRITVDKKYFGKYHSAEVHTHKKAIPKKAYYFAAFLIIFIGFVFHLFNGGLSLTKENEKEVQQQPMPDNKAKFNQSDIDQIVEAIDYKLKFKPRVEGLPFTASIYDDAIDVKSYPRVSGCMEYKYCVCNTQQGTLIDMPQELCRHFMTHGNFNFAKSDEDIEKEQGQYLATGENQAPDEQNYQ